MKIKTFLVDDESHCLDLLTDTINKSFSELAEVVGTATSKSTAIEKIVALRPDLVFLDIKLGDESGFDILSECPFKDFKTIFVTGFDQFALKALKFSAVDYILKPIDPNELQVAMDKVKSTVPSQYDLLLHNLSSSGQKNPKLAIPSLNGFEFISIKDIIRCESDINYTKVFFKNSPPLLVPKTLKEFEKILVHYDFCRVHNSHLINLDYIKSYSRGKGGILVMKDSTEIEVSIRKKTAFLQKLLFLD
ncbi:LytR/AlgR family response regulator transcription factor [Arthrospiribacter ruber]|uniref:DNA-binding response regulator n=1 Tax=Arthrospiribacter ruber TaxID=2487934 RepID=A0A951IUC9_9BACT|nr:DNA-binding response regulator [Arthrospiribacter ruber]